MKHPPARLVHSKIGPPPHLRSEFCWTDHAAAKAHFSQLAISDALFDLVYEYYVQAELIRVNATRTRGGIEDDFA